MKKIFSFIAETGSLMFMPRAHKRSLLNTFDSIASHSHHVSIIAYCIARLEGLSHEDGIKAMAMGAIHDIAESRTSDLDYIAKHYATRDESKANQAQMASLPFKDDLLKLIQEYEERETHLSKCVKDADALEQMYQEWVLMHTGNKMAEKWFVGDMKNRLFRTKSAQKLRDQMQTSHPHEWWYQDLVEGGINNEHLNGKK